MFQRLSNALSGLRAISQFDRVLFTLCQRLLGRRLGWTMYSKRRLTFLVDHLAGDQSGTRDCIAGPMYRELFKEMQLPRQLRLLDLGANGGGFPLLCLDLGFELSDLTCVEVNPFTHSRLTLNIRHNVGLRPKILNVAIGGHPRELTLSFPTGGTGFSIYGSADGVTNEEAIIEVLTFDEIMSRGFADGAVDLCKMDVEGAEYEVFLGDSSASLRLVHYLVIEIHAAEPAKQDALHRKLTSYGFDRIKTSSACDDVHLFVNRQWSDSSRR
ncbi:MAG: FkbM family methyltransferase [Prosthecobacter sp.]|uniref:FkbM family methyltransferase n=1 Tax=Prosthecobacter sp. TaxID=1965333 RepID=UPI0025FABA78|nr:FkbM family methyltransferase [Prosthecobacter sp.]MCF7784632.1 FkbM family methyltransferase [Prosthecobacter sp.]